MVGVSSGRGKRVSFLTASSPTQEHRGIRGLENKRVPQSPMKSIRKILKTRRQLSLAEKGTDVDFLLDLSFTQTKKAARKYYFQFLDGKFVKVPALKGEEVHFTREGWEHLLAEKRSTHEILTRLFTLTRVPLVLLKAARISSQTSRLIEGKNFATIEYWAFEEVIRGVLVKVVVASYDGGPKFFLSSVWKGTKRVSGTKKRAVSRL